MNCGYLRILEARLDKQNEINALLNGKIIRSKKYAFFMGMLAVTYALLRCSSIDKRIDILESRMRELESYTMKGEN